MFNSKIEVRVESVRLATLVEGATPENIIELSKKIGEYLLDGVDMPEVYDQTTAMKTMSSMMLGMKSVGNEK